MAFFQVIKASGFALLLYGLWWVGTRPNIGDATAVICAGLFYGLVVTAVAGVLLFCALKSQDAIQKAIVRRRRR